MPISPAVADRLVVAPEVAAALAEGRPVVALESTLISHGLPYPQNLEVALGVRGGGPRDRRRRAGDGRDPRRAAARRAGRGRPRGAGDRAGRVRPQGRATDPGGRAGRGRLGGDDGVGDDDRGPRGGDPGVRHGRHRRRASRGAGTASGGGRAAPPSTSRPTSRSSAGRRWPSCAPARRRSSTCRPRSSTSRPGACRSSRSGRRSCPGSSPGRRGSRRRTSSRTWREAAAVVAVHLGLGLGSGVLVCVPVPADAALPDDVARDAVERAIADAEAAGVHGPALTPWLLARIAELTDGASVRANTALIVNDARVAGELAAHLLARADARPATSPWLLPRAGGARYTRRTRGCFRVGDAAPRGRGPPDRATGSWRRTARMRIYEGSPRQDFEEVFRSIGAFLDQRGMKDVLLLEAPDGFIVQGLVTCGPGAAAPGPSRSGRRPRRRSPSSTTTSRGSWRRPPPGAVAVQPPAAGAPGGLLRDGVPRARPIHGRAEAAGRVLLRAGRRVRRPPADGGQAGSRHELAEFTREDIAQMVASGPPSPSGHEPQLAAARTSA